MRNRDFSSERINVLDRGPSVVTPDFNMVCPDSWGLLSVDEERQCDTHRTHPYEEDEERWASFSDVGLHSVHDTEEPVAGNNGEGEDTWDEGQN